MRCREVHVKRCLISYFYLDAKSVVELRVYKVTGILYSIRFVFPFTFLSCVDVLLGTNLLYLYLISESI
jgi:hypothetical protein